MTDRTVSMRVQVGGAVRGQYLRALETAQERQERLTGALAGTKKQLGAVAAARDYERRLKELRSRQDAAGKSSEDLTAEIRQVSAQYERAKRSARTLGADVGDLAGEHGRLTREAARAGRELQRVDTRMRAGEGLRRQWAGALASVGTLYAAGRIAAGAADQKQETLYLRTVFNQVEGGGDIARQVGDAVASAREYAYGKLASESELIEISYSLHSAGLDAQAADAGSKIVHQVARVTKGAATQVGETVGTVYNVLGKRAEEGAEEAMLRIGGVLTRTQLKYQFRDFGQLGEGLNYATGVAATYRVSLEQTAAALGVLNTGGVQGSRAGTAFGAVLRSLGKASEKLGFGIQRDAEGMLDLVGTIEALDQRTANLDTDARAALFQELFGDEGKAGLSPLLEMLDRFRDGAAELADPAIGKAVSENYELLANGPKGIWERAGQNVKQVGRAWADSIEPFTNAIGKVVGAVGSAVAQALDRVPALGWAVTGAMGAWIGYRVAVLGALAAQWLFPGAVVSSGSALGALRVGLVAVRAGLVATATAIRVAGVAFLTSPIGWVVGGIAVAAGLIIKYWQPVKAFFGGFFAGVKEGFGPLPGILGRIVGWVGQVVRWFLNLFKPVDASAEALAGAANAGKLFGQAIGLALKFITAPLRWTLWAMGALADLVGKVAGTPPDAFERWIHDKPRPRAPGDALDPPDGGPTVTARGRRRPRAPAVAGALAAGLTLSAAAETPDTEFGLSEQADLHLPADVELPSGTADRAQGAAGRTLHQTITIGPIYVQVPPGADVDALVSAIEQRLGESLRRAAADAALAEDDLA